MDCKKIIEIYSEFCKQQYIVNDIIVMVSQIQIGRKSLQLQADHNCLESMKMLSKYCKYSGLEKDKPKS